MRALLLSLSLAALSGCAVSVPDLGPLLAPADDAGCPAGLQRFQTLCAKPCASAADCPAGTACTASGGGGVCVVDCTADARACLDRCPELEDDCATRKDQDCQRLPLDARFGCIPGAPVVGVTPDAGPQPTPDAGPSNPCTGVEGVQGGCGKDQCAGKTTGHDKCGHDPCPDHAQCGDHDTCTCDPGYQAVDCLGNACAGHSCGKFWCQPAAQVLSCTTANAQSNVICFCKNTGTTLHSLACTATQTCEQFCEQVQP